MKFRCERDALAEALSVAARAATGRTGASPVLSGLRLTLAGDRLQVTGTDRELWIELDVSVGGERDGGTVVPAKLTSDIVRALPSGAVTVDHSADDVAISAGRSNFSVRALTYDDFPQLTRPAAGEVTLDAATFGEALRQVVRAASTDENRPSLTGVLMAAENGGLRLVATDSYRLALRDLPGVSALGPDQKVLVPARALNELQRLFGLGDTVVLRLGEQDATFEIGHARLTTRLITSEFPAYQGLIPPSLPNSLTVAREPLLEAIRRMKILARETASITSVLKLNISADRLQLATINQEVGTASEDLDAQASGDELVVSFNPDYLAAGVEAVTTDEVTVLTTDPRRPAIIRGVGNEEFTYLLMPVRA